jgi:hypothetical protein
MYRETGHTKDMKKAFISRRTKHKNALVSFAKIEHATRKKKHKITGFRFLNTSIVA